MSFCYKVYRSGNEVLVAACDKDLNGRVFNEDDRVLDVKKDFYGDDIAEWKHLEPFLAEATILNLVGDKLITRAIEGGYIDAKNVLRVRGIPHAQMVMI